MKRILFCELCPFAYRLSTEKEILKRHLKDTLHKTRFAHQRTLDSLPVVVYRHNSLIRRRLGAALRLHFFRQLAAKLHFSKQ